MYQSNESLIVILVVGIIAAAPAVAAAPSAAPMKLRRSIVPSAADGERIFKQLSQNGSISMPFQKTFWSPGFGMAVDRFGIPWMINCEKPMQ